MSTKLSEELQRDIDAQLQGGRSLGNKTVWYKVPNDGNFHRFRVLPGEYGKSKEVFFIAVEQHWVVQEGTRLPIYCPKSGGVGDCPFCDAKEDASEEEKQLKEELKTHPDPERKVEIETELEKLQRLIGFLYPRAAYMMNILDRDDGVEKVYSSPKTVFNQILTTFSQEGVEIFDVKEGSDFRIKSEKKGKSYQYTVALERQSTPIADSAAKITDVLGRRVDLSGLVQYKTFEELEKLAKDGIKKTLSAKRDELEEAPAATRHHVQQEPEVQEAHKTGTQRRSSLFSRLSSIEA